MKAYLFSFFPFFFFFFGSEWSMMPACPSLVCFFDRGGTWGTNCLKILCLMFVYVLFDVNLCTGLILWFLNNLWFDDLRAE